LWAQKSVSGSRRSSVCGGMVLNMGSGALLCPAAACPLPRAWPTLDFRISTTQSQRSYVAHRKAALVVVGAASLAGCRKRGQTTACFVSGQQGEWWEGRQAELGDTIVLSYRVSSRGDPSGVLWKADHAIHVVGSALPGGLPVELVADVLTSLREGQSRCGVTAEREWTLHLEQVCAPQGRPLGGSASTGPHGASQKAAELVAAGVVALRGTEEGALGSREVQLLRGAASDRFASALECLGTGWWRENHRFSDVTARDSQRLHLKLEDLRSGEDGIVMTMPASLLSPQIGILTPPLCSYPWSTSPAPTVQPSSCWEAITMERIRKTFWHLVFLQSA